MMSFAGGLGRNKWEGRGGWEGVEFVHNCPLHHVMQRACEGHVSVKMDNLYLLALQVWSSTGIVVSRYNVLQALLLRKE